MIRLSNPVEGWKVSGRTVVELHAVYSFSCNNRKLQVGLILKHEASLVPMISDYIFLEHDMCGWQWN